MQTLFQEVWSGFKQNCRINYNNAYIDNNNASEYLKKIECEM